MDKPPVEYRWALDAADRPVPITLARRGERYICPLCRREMVARLGAHLQHHFSHLEANACDSESVSIAALRRWLALNFDQALNERRAIRSHGNAACATGRTLRICSKASGTC